MVSGICVFDTVVVAERRVTFFKNCPRDVGPPLCAFIWLNKAFYPCDCVCVLLKRLLIGAQYDTYFCCFHYHRMA